MELEVGMEVEMEPAEMEPVDGLAAEGAAEEGAEGQLQWRHGRRVSCGRSYVL